VISNTGVQRAKTRREKATFGAEISKPTLLMMLDATQRFDVYRPQYDIQEARIATEMLGT